MERIINLINPRGNCKKSKSVKGRYIIKVVKGNRKNGELEGKINRGKKQGMEFSDVINLEEISAEPVEWLCRIP